MNPQDQFLRWARATTGTREGSGRQRRWAAAAGVAWTVPWCSAWIAYGLRKAGIKPPSNPAYSGSWLEWKDGIPVEGGLKNAQPGDLLIFDWGDGGITDHVAAYLGGGRMIAGNNADNTVGTSTVPAGNLVGIIRPRQFLNADDFFDGTFSSVGDIPGNVADTVTDAAGGVAGEVIDGIAGLLGQKAAAILLNIGLVGGGALLVYYGVAKMAGVDEPVMQLAARTPAGAAAGAAS